jgi:uncharacterized coiled-coil protein SlyX
MDAPPADPRLVGYREMDARLRPLEIQVARMDAALSDIPRRQTQLESEMSQLRVQISEMLTMLREMRAQHDAEHQNDDNPMQALALALHRQLDEKTSEDKLDMAAIANKSWDVAKLIALVLVIVIGGKQALGLLV